MDKADLKAVDLQQLFLAMTEEVRIIVVKLADRLHNMRTLGSMPPEKQQKIANETLQVGMAGRRAAACYPNIKEFKGKLSSSQADGTARGLSAAQHPDAGEHREGILLAGRSGLCITMPGPVQLEVRPWLLTSAPNLA